MNKKLKVAAFALTGIAASCLVYGAATGYVCYKTGFKAVGYDRNYVAERDGNDPPKKGSPYRKKCFDGNRWWSEQEKEILSITSRDGLTLRAGLKLAERIDGSHGDDFAIVCHGHKCCAGEVGFLAKMYLQQGVNVLVIDQRAQGSSDGKYMTMGELECVDVLDWARLLARRYPKAKIVLHGCSMGAATVLMCSPLPLPKQVVGIIADSGYTTAKEAFRSEMIHYHKALPLKSLTLAMSRLYYRLFTPYHIRKASPIDAVKHCRLPILFIHGTADTAVPCHMSREMYEAAECDKQLEIFEGSTHCMSYFDYPDRYTDVCLDFLGRCKDSKTTHIRVAS